MHCFRVLAVWGRTRYLSVTRVPHNIECLRVKLHCQSWEPVADPECARGGGVSHILAEKGVVASLDSKKCMKMQYFHQEGGGGVRRVRPVLDPPLGNETAISDFPSRKPQPLHQDPHKRWVSVGRFLTVIHTFFKLLVADALNPLKEVLILIV